MRIETQAWAQAQIDRVRETHPVVVELACLLSPTVFVETELLRAMRLAMAKRTTPAVEATLWFSPLVGSRSAAGVTFRPAVAARLREQLARDWQDPARRPQIETARQVIERVHRDLSPALALEERVAWHVVAQDWDAVDTELERAVRAFLGGRRPGIASWAAQAWNRLPAAAQTTHAARRFYQVARSASGPVRLRPLPSPELAVGTDLASLAAQLSDVKLGVRRNGSQLELGNIAAQGTAAVLVPDTQPRLVDVVWRTGQVEQARRLAIPIGEKQVLDVGSGAVRLRTAKGVVYELPALRTETEAEGWATMSIEGEEGGGLRFRVALPGGPRSESHVTPKARQSLDQRLSFLGNPGLWRELEAGLSGVIVPHELRAVGLLKYNWILTVDELAAGYPWEIYREDVEGKLTRLALSRGLVRRTKSGDAWPEAVESRSERVTGNHALVLHGPELGEEAQNSSRAEAVMRLLQDGGLVTMTGSALTSPMSVLEAVADREFRVLHLSGLAELGPEGETGTNAPRVRFAGNLWLGAVELAQLRCVPELVFLDLSYPRRTRGESASNRRSEQAARGEIAAAWGARLAALKVKALVVNGWGVDASSALAFITEFYKQLLAGRKLWQAVLAARQHVARLFPESNAWAAFQCYGDPEFRLEPVSRGLRSATDAPSAIPDVLSCRIDRHAQAKAVHEGLVRKPRQRPLVFVLFGERGQGHEAFLQLVQHWILPREFPEQPPIRRLDLRGALGAIAAEPEFSRRLVKEISDRFAISASTVEELALQLRSVRGAVTVSLGVRAADYPDAGIGCLKRCLDFWKRWPDLPPGTPLLGFLSVVLDPPESGWLENRRRNQRLQALRAFLGGLEESSGCVVLPELTSVGFADLDHWLHEPEVAALLPSRPSEAALRQLFRERETIPMDEAIDRAMDLLKEGVREPA